MNMYAKQLIRRFEGHSYRPYRCPAGYWTIGWGHKIMYGERFSALTDIQAEALLDRDLKIRMGQLYRMVRVPLKPYQEGALLSFLYNVGEAALQRSTLRMKLNRGDYDGAGAEFHRWVWARGVRLQGLVIRRMAEAHCYGGDTSMKKIKINI